MSDRTRDIITVLMVILLAVAAFAAGFLINDLLDAGSGQAEARAAEEDFTIFWEAWSRIEGSYIGQLPTSKEMTYGAIRGVVTVLNDPYTIFVEPVAREFERDELRGLTGGVGATVSRNEDGDVVLAPIPGNPAEAAGILDGDILLAVDGQEVTAEMTVQDVAQMVRGEVGTIVTLTILHPDANEPVDIEVERGQILIPSVTYRLLEEDETIGYIQLSRFSGESAGEIGEAILALQEQGAEQLILDLRHNPGGLLDAAVDVSNHFLNEGPVLIQISKSEEEKVFMSGDETTAGEMPLVVLVDGNTASSSEILAGALKDRQRATLIGSTTFGKGSVQLVYDLSDGSSIHVTSARWFTPDRHQIDQQGLDPDIFVELTQEAIDAGRDEVLERAVVFLQQELTASQ